MITKFLKWSALAIVILILGLDACIGFINGLDRINREGRNPFLSDKTHSNIDEKQPDLYGQSNYQKEKMINNELPKEFPSPESLSEINVFDKMYSTGDYTEDLKNLINENNRKCPVNIMDGIAIVVIKDELIYVTHYCIVNEDEWNFEGMAHDELTKIEMKNAIKHYIKENSNANPLFRNTILLYVLNTRGIKYHFYGARTDSYMDIVISCAELNRLINTTNNQ